MKLFGRFWDKTSFTEREGRILNIKPSAGYVEITSPVLPGYSGSPVVDAKGEVVAVVSLGGDGSTTWGVRLDEPIAWEPMSLPRTQNTFTFYDPFETVIPPAPEPRESPKERAARR